MSSLSRATLTTQLTIALLLLLLFAFLFLIFVFLWGVLYCFVFGGFVLEFFCGVFCIVLFLVVLYWGFKVGLTLINQVLCT
jgi:hypothetical protein